MQFKQLTHFLLLVDKFDFLLFFPDVSQLIH